jgi:hypothetical protein
LRICLRPDLSTACDGLLMMRVRRCPVFDIGETRRTRVAGALHGWRWRLTQIIDIEQKLIMMVTSGLDFHGTEGDRLVACPTTPRVVSRFRCGHAGMHRLLAVDDRR